MAEYLFMKVDIVEHSSLLLHGRSSEVWPLLDDFYAFVKNVVEAHGGELWDWQGDGGLCSFKSGPRRSLVDKGMQAALKILRGVSPFALEPEPFRGAKTGIKIRIAVHLGTAQRKSSRGCTHSPDINLTAHLEREAFPNSIVTTEQSLNQCQVDTRKLFKALRKVRSQEFYGEELWICDCYGPGRIDSWEEVLVGTGILYRKIMDMAFRPDLIIGCGRSAGIVGAILAGNLNQENFVVLSRCRTGGEIRRIEVNRVALLSEDESYWAQNPKILLAFYQINTCRTLEAYFGYLRESTRLQGSGNVLVATLYLSKQEGDAIKQAKKAKLSLISAYERQPEWATTPWKLNRDWRYV